MADEKIKRGPGRPTDKRKDTVLRLRIDAETHKKLNRCAEKRQVSMSEIVREAEAESYDAKVPGGKKTQDNR